MNKCKCGCGQKVRWTWVNGHYLRGGKSSVKHRKNLSLAAVARVHQLRGEEIGTHLLTEKEASDIQSYYKEELECRRRDGFQQVSRGFATELAEYYDVTRSTISKCGLGHNWHWKLND